VCIKLGFGSGRPQAEVAKRSVRVADGNPTREALAALALPNSESPAESRHRTGTVDLILAKHIVAKADVQFSDSRSTVRCGCFCATAS
jgi:hypothetical protein